MLMLGLPPVGSRSDRLGSLNLHEPTVGSSHSIGKRRTPVVFPCIDRTEGHGVSAEVGHELMAIKQTNPIACRFIPRVHCKADSERAGGICGKADDRRAPSTRSQAICESVVEPE